MKNNLRGAAQLGAAAFTLSLLIGCGDGPSAGHFETAINDYFSGEPKCWSLEDMENARFPLRVAKTARDSAILVGLAEGGFIAGQEERRETMFGSETTLSLDLTDKGRDAKVWDAKQGFCIGTPKVVEVLEWTEPAQDNGQLVSRVQFTWKLAGRPSWVEPKLFAKVEGMGSEPEKMILPLLKTNKGWRVPGELSAF